MRIIIVIILLLPAAILLGQVDHFSTSPEGTFDQRKQAFLQYCVANDTTGGGRYNVFSQIARMELGIEVKENVIRDGIKFIYSNRDCNDFTVGALIRIVYLNQKKPQLSQPLLNDINACLLDFKYWWNDSRRDTVYRCYHTENHQILCHADELLAGQLYKDKVFSNNQTGVQHMDHAAPLIETWMDLRFRLGFSEWLSNSYYEVEILTLANLYDFSEDKIIRDHAALLMDLLLFDMALNNYQGVFGSTHGRAYANGVKGGRKEPTSPISKLVFGVGSFNSSTCMGGAALASSNYRCPEIICNIATDYSDSIRSQQRISINVEDASQYGLNCNSEQDLNYFWGMQEFIHPSVIQTSKKISQQHDVWPYRNYDDYSKIYNEQIKQYGKVITPNLDRFALSEANIETYRTPDYMLSCANNYRPGAKGYQQHIWQATLGPDAVVFTTYPGSKHENVAPNYWAGNAIMPNAVQHKNVMICIYNAPSSEKIDFTHAYFPKEAFDEVVQKGNWTFGRKGDGYIALYSKQTVKWEANNDLIAAGRQNVWVCEMGTKTEWGNFDNFVRVVSSAHIQCPSNAIHYQSPSRGSMQFGWDESLLINGQEVVTDDYMRYNNPYCQAPFNSQKIEIKRNNKSLVLNYKTIFEIVHTLSKSSAHPTLLDIKQ